MKVLICSNPECATFEWGNPDEEPDINQPCIFCHSLLRKVTKEEQEDANKLTGVGTYETQRH